MPPAIYQNFLHLVGVDRKQGVDNLSTSGLHKNKVSYSTNDFVKHTISLHGWDPNNLYTSINTGCRASSCRDHWSAYT